MSNLQELQNYTFVSKYARWLEHKQRRETWKEAVNRVRDMMHEQYKDYGIQNEIDWVYDMMLKKKVLGSQRALQFGGKPMLKKHARGYNCTSSYCDRLRFFQECLWLMLCGCGTGYSVQKHHVDKLPKFATNFENYVKKPVVKYSIADTIEGWADALGQLIQSYFDSNLPRVQFDFSQIRPAGSPLSSGIGKAPGPDGLRKALEKIDELLLKCLENNQTKLKTIDCYDIVCHSADAVLSGGVRRSATNAIFGLDDKDMMEAKTGNWWDKNPQRGRSNNSVILLRDEITKDTFKDIIECTRQFGEPGFVFADDKEALFNPCYEIQFYAYDSKGNSGWQVCTLSSINCATVQSVDDYLERAKAAAILGTLQAGYTNFDYLGPTSEEIIRREALLGVSMTGIMEKYEIVLNPVNQKAAAKIVKETNKKLANKIGINQAARTTCLKPEGNASCVLGTCSGIHPHHAKRYIRRVQANKQEQVYNYFKQVNPQACEESVWSNTGTDDVIAFPVEVPDGAKTKNQVPALDLLNIVKSTQLNWVNTGRNKDLCVKPWLSHNVSNTITVQDDEWDEVGLYLYKNKKHFCAVSLLPESGDKDYPQAPFVTVHTSREIVREYGDASIWCSGLIELAIRAYKTDVWKACSDILKNDYVETINSVSITDPKSLRNRADRIELYHKARRFADKYFESDYKRLTYCLKDVYNWKMYCDLTRTFKAVDYIKMIEHEDNTAPEQEISCAGGACLIT